MIYNIRIITSEIISVWQYRNRNIHLSFGLICGNNQFQNEKVINLRVLIIKRNKRLYKNCHETAICR